MPGLVFLGTPDFAVPCLRQLLECKADVRLVITQPDRASGRGRKIHQSAVKKLAIEGGLPVYQPERVRGEEVIETIRSYGAEIAVVAAFGQLLPQSLLDIFPLGSLNIHGSLLPRLRGAAPIQRSILAGEELTGISIMLLDAGLDTGPVLLQKEVSISPEDSFGKVYGELAEKGAELLLEALRDWPAGRLSPLAQDGSLATYAPPISKEELRINWNSAAKDIINQVRAFDPAPGAWFSLGGKRVKCFHAASVSWAAAGGPGEVIGMAEGGGLIVAAGGGGWLCLGELQMEGMRRMSAGQFARGRSIPQGSFLE
ncbi:MAG: methionyl-tRNA formyltransferase [Syntrophobacteraceae bacterium]|nr:methionyl-tRNA formyltransferase [Syntrophobacteraceae bacterium]